MHCNVSQDLFIKEFIERDLFHATELRQIRWSFLGNKPTKEQIKAFMKAGKTSLNLLPANKKALYFPNYDNIAGISDHDINIL